ncbi:HNH endonuclease signature motif containing protein [Actinoallomurus oryzae]
MDVLMQAPQTPSSEVLGVDAGGLYDQELVETMVRARRLASRVQAVELAAVAELTRRRFAEAEGRDPAVEVLSPADYVFDEVAEALTLTATAADGLIRFATELTGQLPGTFAALAAGEIDYLKARTIWHAVDQVDEESMGIIEAKVLPKAPEQSTGQIRAKIRRLIKRLDPEMADRRRAEAEKRRGVELVESEDGTAHLTGVDLPADAASAAYGRVSAIATGLKRDGDGRGIDQLRADVFLGLLRGTFATSEPPADTTERPTPKPPATGEPGWTAVDDAIADVIADAARTELAILTHALNDTRRGSHCDFGDLVAEAGSHINHFLTNAHQADGALASVIGAVDGADTDPRASYARSRAYGGRSTATPTSAFSERHHDLGGLIAQAGARIKQSLTELKNRWCVAAPAPSTGDAAPAITGDAFAPDADAAYGPCPDGRAKHGAARYRPPAVMRRLIESRDRRCVFPGCRRPARHCDADHSIPYHRGGATCPCNLSLLCRRHHREKATPGWHIEHLWPGVILWITPTGHWKITAPADRE